MKIHIIPYGKDFISFENVDSWVYEDGFMKIVIEDGTPNERISYYSLDNIEFFNVFPDA